MNSARAERDFAGRDGLVGTNVSTLRNHIIRPRSRASKSP
jgi:hypothetical protein